MYRRIAVTNFRGLERLVVEDLGRLNLFVGPNNVGKTSLLEAIWLLQAPANPTLTANLAAFRGFDPSVQAPDLFWHPLFFDLDTARTIEIVGSTAGGVSETLRISLSQEWLGGPEPNGGGITPSQAIIPAANPLVSPETLRYEYVPATGGPTYVVRFSLGLGRAGLRAEPELPAWPATSGRQSIYLAARHRTTPEELADRFTRSQDRVGTGELVKSLAVLQPGLTDLSIGFSLVNRQPSLRARLAGLASPIPLQLLGEGVSRLTEVLLAVPAVGQGVLLVDEIENGLYYRNMEPAWRAIDVARRRAGTQVFATTHSLECVQAAVRALDGRSAVDFRLHRLERIDGQVRVVTYDHQTAEAALDIEIEFR